MVLIETLTELFINHNNWAYVILFLGAYFETFFGLGFVVYGELFFLAGAILAGSGELNIYIVIAVAIVGGILGDSTGYWIGRRFGSKFLKRIFQKEKLFFNVKNYKKAKDFFKKHGNKSIFFGRFTGVFSCVFPFLAGSLHIKYKDFLKYNIPAVIIGISQFLLVGYLFGYSYSTFLPKAEKYVFYAIIIIIVIIYAFFRKSGEAKNLDKGLLKKIEDKIEKRSNKK